MIWHNGLVNKSQSPFTNRDKIKVKYGSKHIDIFKLGNAVRFADRKTNVTYYLPDIDSFICGNTLYTIENSVVWIHQSIPYFYYTSEISNATWLTEDTQMFDVFIFGKQFKLPNRTSIIFPSGDTIRYIWNNTWAMPIDELLIPAYFTGWRGALVKCRSDFNFWLRNPFIQINVNTNQQLIYNSIIVNKYIALRNSLTTSEWIKSFVILHNWIEDNLQFFFGRTEQDFIFIPFAWNQNSNENYSIFNINKFITHCDIALMTNIPSHNIEMPTQYVNYFNWNNTWMLVDSIHQDDIRTFFSMNNLTLHWDVIRSTSNTRSLPTIASAQSYFEFNKANLFTTNINKPNAADFIIEWNISLNSYASRTNSVFSPIEKKKPNIQQVNLLWFKIPLCWMKTKFDLIPVDEAALDAALKLIKNSFSKLPKTFRNLYINN